MRRAAVAAAIVLALAAVAGCNEATPERRPTTLPPRPKPLPEHPELARVRPYHNTYAVTAVHPFAWHFAVSWRDVEPSYCHAEVVRDEATGSARADLRDCMWGGVPEVTTPRSAIPREVAHLVPLVERAVRERDGDVRRIAIAYAGAWREVHVAEYLFTSPKTGWWAESRLRADAGLTGLYAPPAPTMSAFGSPEDTEQLDFVDVAPPPEIEGTRLVLASEKPAPFTDAIVARALAVARAGKGDDLEAVLARQGDGVLPRGFDERVFVNVVFYARGPAEPKSAVLRVPLRLRDVKSAGTAHGEAETVLEGVTIRGRADLAGDAGASGKVVWKLALHLESSAGDAYDRSWPARGAIVVDGDAVASVGFEIPGASSPSPAADALHASWRAPRGFTNVDLYVSPGVESDPRHPPG